MSTLWLTLNIRDHSFSFRENSSSSWEGSYDNQWGETDTDNKHMYTHHMYTIRWKFSFVCQLQEVVYTAASFLATVFPYMMRQ